MNCASADNGYTDVNNAYRVNLHLRSSTGRDNVALIGVPG